MHICTYIYTYIPWIHKYVIKTVGCRTNCKYTRIQIYSVKYFEHFTKQYYRLSLHIKNSSTECKECVGRYFLKAALNFALSFLGIVTLGGKLL